MEHCEHFILFDREDLSDRQIMNARVRKVYAWADARGLKVREEHIAWGDESLVPRPEALNWAVGECAKHECGLLVWEATLLGEPGVISSVVRQMESLPVIAVQDESRLTVREHEVIGMEPVRYPVVRWVGSEEGQ